MTFSPPQPLCATLALAALLAAPLAHAQSTPPPDPNAAAIAALQTYELPDQTASIRLPTSWSVVATGIGFIQARGPNHELALFGVDIPATDSSTPSPDAAGITDPYNSAPSQKFLDAINWIRARNNKPQVTAQFYSDSPVSAPAAFGKCDNITAVLNGAIAVETDFCTLPEDSSGNYKIFFKAVGLPAQEAKQERTLLEAILSSYRLNMDAVKKQRQSAPSQPTPGGSASSTISAENSLVAGQLMMQEANAINAETEAGIAGSDASVNDFDHGVLRGQTPIYAQGMSQPMFWVGN